MHINYKLMDNLEVRYLVTLEMMLSDTVISVATSKTFGQVNHFTFCAHVYNFFAVQDNSALLCSTFIYEWES